MIMVNNLARGYEIHREEYEEKVLEVLRSGWYVLGREVELFEYEWAKYIGTKYCVGVGNGLDALTLAFRALGIGKGDEVIVQGNAYIACVMGITLNGATPIFVEPDEYYSIDVEKLEEKITQKTKAILVVHLYGIPANMERLVEICKKHNIPLIEDCAQSHGAKFNNQQTGSFGTIGCFSFYPSKNLGAFGDGGAIVTNDEKIAEMIKVFRNYGSEKRYHNMVVGVNSRLDEIQAGLLRVKFRHFEELICEREKIACRYLKEIKNDEIQLPKERQGIGIRNVWHQFVIQCKQREDFMNYLNANNIATLIHYPIPAYLSEAYAYLGYKKGFLPITEQYADTVCSLPIYNGMTEEEQTYVIKVINSYKINR